MLKKQVERASSINKTDKTLLDELLSWDLMNFVIVTIKLN